MFYKLEILTCFTMVTTNLVSWASIIDIALVTLDIQRKLLLKVVVTMHYRILMLK